MSRLFGFLAVTAIAFACTPRSIPVSADEPLVEREPELVIPEDVIIELERPHIGLDGFSEAFCLPDPERFEKSLKDEMISTDNLGLPPMPVPENFHVPEPTYPSVGPRRRNFSLRSSGGNGESERAVALGLAWLAREQRRSNGSWMFDQGERGDRVTATGLALLPFLLAGETHFRPQFLEGTYVLGESSALGIDETHRFLRAMAERSVTRGQPEQICGCFVLCNPKWERWQESKYERTVATGLDFLRQQCPLSGPKAGRFANTTMTGQAIATLALCEAYAATGDPSLKVYAQVAVSFLQKSQNLDGGWSDTPDAASDIFVFGWAIQALESARHAKELSVDPRVLKRASQFLDSVAAGSRKSMYGTVSRNGAQPGTTPTAIGLFCRYDLDSWGSSHTGMIDGVAGLTKNAPAIKLDPLHIAQIDPLFLYFATQVVWRYEGEDWWTWNKGPRGEDGQRSGGVRDILVKSQNRKDGALLGSWEATGDTGARLGRLGTTVLNVLTLEVYYRDPAVYKRHAPAAKAPE